MLMSIDRAMGFYPISIPTSLAIESITSTGEFLSDNEPPITKYDVIMVNVRTLVRNLVNAFGKEYEKLTLDVAVESVAEDVKGILEALEYGGFKAEVELYYTDYTDISKSFPNAVLKEPTTTKQAVYADYTSKIVEAIKDTTIRGLPVKHYSWKLSSVRRVLMLTHLALDLVKVKEFKQLTLLESHTGKLKGSDLFHTKLNLPKDCGTIPFNGLMLQVFGDNSLFKVHSQDLKKRILKASVSNRWHLLTTETRIKDSLKLTDKYAYELISTMRY